MHYMGQIYMRLNNYINGDGGNDLIEGGQGSDILAGDAGDDTIAGGTGNDTLNAQGGCVRWRTCAVNDAEGRIAA